VRIRNWLIYLFLCGLNPAAAREFVAEGSDLLMGIGPIQIARGSAVVASDNGIYSLFWNPAGLAQLTHHQWALAGQFNRELAHISFAGVAFVLPKIVPLGLKSVVGLSYVPRAHFKAKGAFKPNEIETTFMQSGLPGMIGGFNGKLTSKTSDYRVGLGVRFDTLPELDLGASVGRIRCHTLFAGYHKDDTTNFTQKEIWANAWAIDLGARYHINDDLTLGITLKNINADLDVKTVTIDSSGTRTRLFSVPYIKDLSIGLDYRYSDNLSFALAYQFLYGTYNTSSFDFKLLRAGGTYHYGNIDYHFGLIAPIKISGSKIKNIKLPAPAMPTFGLSYTHDDITVGTAIYFHPIKSLAANSVKPVIDFSLSYKF
jgi:long-subunit fatty acid transport protein